MPFTVGNKFATDRHKHNKAKKDKQIQDGRKGGHKKQANRLKQQTTPYQTPSQTPTLSSKKLRKRKICAGNRLTSSTKIIDIEEMQKLNEFTNQLMYDHWICYHCGSNKIITCDPYYRAAICYVNVACYKCKTHIKTFKLGKHIENINGDKYSEIAMKIVADNNEKGYSHAGYQKSVFMTDMNPMSKQLFYNIQKSNDNVEIGYANHCINEAIETVKDKYGVDENGNCHLDLTSDGSFASRRNSKSGTSTFIDPDTGLVLAQHDMTRGSNFEGCSARMESAGDRKNLKSLAEKGVFIKTLSKDNDTNGQSILDEYNTEYEEILKTPAELLKDTNHYIKNAYLTLTKKGGKTNYGRKMAEALKKDNPNFRITKEWPAWIGGQTRVMHGAIRKFKNMKLDVKNNDEDWEICSKYFGNMSKHYIINKSNKNHKKCDADFCNFKNNPNYKSEHFVIDGEPQKFPSSYNAQKAYSLFLRDYFNRKTVHKLIKGKSTQSNESYNSLKRNYIKTNPARTGLHFESQSKKGIALTNKGYISYLERQKLRGLDASHTQIKMAQIREENKAKNKTKQQTKKAKKARVAKKLKLKKINKDTNKHYKSGGFM